MPTRGAINRKLKGKSLNPFKEVGDALEGKKEPSKDTQPISHKVDLNAPQSTTRQAALYAAMRKQIDAKSKFKRSSTNKGKS